MRTPLNRTVYGSIELLCPLPDKAGYDMPDKAQEGRYFTARDEALATTDIVSG